MRLKLLPLSVAGAALALAGCDSGGGGNEATMAQPGEAAEAAGGETIAASLDQNSRMFQAAKAAGLDATLAGPGPYTVFAPTDAAFNALPDGGFDNLTNPENRAELTRVLTYHILPGTVLAEDIGKAIDNSDGQAMLATMGGGTLTAKREGDRIILTDSAGNSATVAEADQRLSNGVVHRIDAVLMPGEENAGQPPAAAEDQATAQ